nr:hypothetical protein [Tanacetum cinerariifolium]
MKLEMMLFEWNHAGFVKDISSAISARQQLSFSVEPYSALDQLQRWEWSLSGDGEFYVSSAITLIDDRTFGMVGSKNQWYWWSWLSSLRLSSKLKMVLQGFFTSLGGQFGSTGIKPSLVLITCQKLDYLTILLLIRLHGVDLEDCIEFMLTSRNANVLDIRGIFNLHEA